ncbi:MAG: PQQ-dependent sugar dehydrogenase [Verrucomicrobia bacterium]|nr:PQQ-dependent sugar dehydrogenase [Verrucomicrobiota bacterium]
MISRHLTFALAILTISPLSGAAAIAVRRVAAGFERPVWAGMPRNIDGKLWVMEQAGRVWIVDLASGQRSPEPFLDIRGEVSRKGNEEGLLGLAFEPDFQLSGRYYVNFTDTEHFTRIVRFSSDNHATTEVATAEVVLRFKQPYENHNGGWLGFGPDGMLYIGNGDGGSGNDPQNHAQTLDTLLGKILRLDVSPHRGYQVPANNPFVNNKAAKPEIWASGVRNPWRCSFDRQTGDFWFGDVGQNAWEEINFMPKGKGAGANYGWRLREGAVATPQEGVGGAAPAGAIEPVYVYPHGSGPKEGLSVTGGYVYRGPIAELQGRYVFADYQNPRIWSLVLKDGKAADFKDHTDALQPAAGRIALISSFAEDNQGNLFILDHSGAVYQIVAK